MRNLTFVISAGLAITGMAMSIGGILGSEFRPVLIGGFLLAGATVFAILHLANRPKAGGTNSLKD